MGGQFACPECGQGLELRGLTPGRAVRCDACETWVEVPFLPRADGWRLPGPARAGSGRGRGRGRPGRWWESKALRGALGFAVLVVGGLMASRMVGGRVRSDRERVLAELVAAGDRAEAAGDPAAALIEAEAALAQARTIDPPGSARLVELDRRRGLASIREARGRLEALGGLDPARAVGEALTLLARSKADPALAPLAPAIEAAADAARLARVEAAADAARRLAAEGRAAEAFAAAVAWHDHAGGLAEADARPARDAAEAAIEDLVARFGIALPPTSGRFLAGSGEGYDRALAPPLLETCKLKGYLPPPAPGSPWRESWDDRAPFRLTLRVAESQDETYLQSRSRATEVEGHYELTRRGSSAWQGRVVARTRQPLPNMTAYQAGHLATSDRRDPAVERRFQDDALAQFIEQSARSFKGIPTRARCESNP